MRAEVAAAERKQEVRRAARSWAKRDLIDAETLAQIERTYADDRSRVGPAFRGLLFLFTFLAVVSAFGLLLLARVPPGGALLTMSIACLMATEFQTGRIKRSSAGSEEATAFLAVVFTLSATAWMFIDTTSDVPWRLWIFMAAVAWALAAWRWCSWPYGVLAAVSAFGMSAYMPATRPIWIVTAGLLAPALLALSRSSQASPSQRRACDAALLVAFTAVYLAVHLGSYDSHLLEGPNWQWSTRFQVPIPGRWFFIAGTAIAPVLLFAVGILWRLPIFYRTAVAFIVVSLVTLRFYIHVAPLWSVLILCGTAAITLGLLTRRFLESGHGGERHGFTAKPLHEISSQARAMEMGLATVLEPSTPEAADDSTSFGVGGELGGGGAGRKF
jgi:hypothetical protein